MDSEGQEMKLYVLLYLDDDRTHVNIKKSRTDPNDIYILCSIGAVKSASERGIHCAIITNRHESVFEKIRELGLTNIEVIQHDFSMEVPTGIRFRQAHFKLEVFKIFASGAFGEWVGLVDGDVVFLKRIRLPNLRMDKLYVYDITATQNTGHVENDVAQICDTRRAAWYGGEFIFGHTSAFDRLVDRVDELWPAYLHALQRGDLNHIGDESVVSAALNTFDTNFVESVNNYDVIIRWWSGRTREQSSFEDVCAHSILHLPLDKPLLAEFSRSNSSYDLFVGYYTKRLRPKLFFQRVARIVDIFIGRKQRTYIPRLK